MQSLFNYIEFPKWLFYSILTVMFLAVITIALQMVFAVEEQLIEEVIYKVVLSDSIHGSDQLR
jgi:hypothetical protein